MKQGEFLHIMKTNNTHGGKREGAGNKRGPRKKEVAISSSINLPPSLWGKLDKLRGTKSRSGYLREVIRAAKLP